MAEDEVAGRPAHHVRCTSVGRHEEYWVDATNGFILRSTDVPTDDRDVRMTGEVRSLLLDAAFDQAVFAFPEDPRLATWMPGGDLPLEPGERVVTNRFAPAFAVTPGDGWRSWGTASDVVGFVRGPVGGSGPDGASLFVISLTVVTDVESGQDVTLEPGVDPAVAWLRTHPYFETTEPEPIRVGSHPAVSLAFQSAWPDDLESTCPRGEPDELPPPCLRMFRADTGYWTYEGTPQVDQRAIFLDVEGTAVMVLISADGPDLEAHRAAIDELLASSEFLE